MGWKGVNEEEGRHSPTAFSHRQTIDARVLTHAFLVLSVRSSSFPPRHDPASSSPATQPLSSSHQRQTSTRSFPTPCSPPAASPTSTYSHFSARHSRLLGHGHRSVAPPSSATAHCCLVQPCSGRSPVRSCAAPRLRGRDPVRRASIPGSNSPRPSLLVGLRARLSGGRHPRRGRGTCPRKRIGQGSAGAQCPPVRRRCY